MFRILGDKDDRWHQPRVRHVAMLSGYGEGVGMLTTAPNLRSVVDRDGAVILDLKRGTMLTLNPTGGYIWERLQQGKLVDEIICDLTRDTGMDFSVIERDVSDFLEQLKSRHVLTEELQGVGGPFASCRRLP
jgi:hypothetical protein